MSKVTEIRRSRGMTQEQFAEFCDISRVSIARYDAGSPLSLINAQKIAKACNISVDYLLDDESFAADSLSLREPFPFLLSPEETQLINDFRKLTARGQKRAIETMMELVIIYQKKHPDQVTETDT